MECAAHSVRAGEVSWRGLCTHTQGMKVQAHVLYFISSFFFCSFLPARSLLSQRLRREVARGGGGGGRFPLCLRRAPIPVQLT